MFFLLIFFLGSVMELKLSSVCNPDPYAGQGTNYPDLARCQLVYYRYNSFVTTGFGNKCPYAES